MALPILPLKAIVWLFRRLYFRKVYNWTRAFLSSCKYYFSILLRMVFRLVQSLIPTCSEDSGEQGCTTSTLSKSKLAEVFDTGTQPRKWYMRRDLARGPDRNR